MGVVALILLVTVFLLAGSDRPGNKFPMQHPSSGKPVDLSSGDLSSSDEDPLKCEKSFDGNRPVTQYVVMLDAGSSGSRVHIYEFNNCRSSPYLVDETFKMLEPGLSSYDNDAEAAAKSLDSLLDLAVNTIPEEYRKCSPVAVKATAGLRILGDEKSDKILKAVEQRLENNYPFPVVQNGVSIMEGKDEGVYAWITANYLLGNIGNADRTTTAAVFDLGGGSTQIVFEPSFDNTPSQKMIEGDHKYDLDFGGRHFSLYQHSHLMFGLNEARKKIDELIVANYIKQKGSLDQKEPITIVNPCLPPNTSMKSHEVLADDGTTTAEGPGQKKFKIDMVGPKDHSELQCRALAEQILNKESECLKEPCSFNGVHQPSLVTNFLQDGQIYIFSYFYDRIYPLGMPQSFSLDELKQLTSQVCKGPEAYDSFSTFSGAIEQLQENPQWCQELNYMLALLHTGYDIPGHREVRIAKKIKGNELGWCLGASLPLLDQNSAGWSCKIKQL